ncbi:hypothetical protein M8J75_009407 [Diaphorina citri]|nr:hypothetical protein M8J75_009407 [Diaphorina citri]KAI5714881.1 hypothetical protein M8J77_006914 [Diaphorina citri]
MDNFFCYVLFLVLTVQIYAANLPSYIKPCKRNSSDLNSCVIDIIKSLKPRFHQGLPELKIPILEPLNLPLVTLDSSGSQVVNFKANFRNMKLHGAKALDVKDVKLDYKGRKLSMVLHLPKVYMTSDYDMNGKVLVLPIRGNGKCSGNFTDVEADVLFSGKFYEKNHKQFVKLDATPKVSIKLGNSEMHFDNLFNGNEELGRSTNNFLNDNWELVSAEVIPLVQDTVSTISYQLFKNVLDVYSVDQLLPEN